MINVSNSENYCTFFRKNYKNYFETVKKWKNIIIAILTVKGQYRVPGFDESIKSV